MTNNYPMFPPITADICELFRKWGIDPDDNMPLIADLMRFVYDEKIAVIEHCKDVVNDTLNTVPSDTINRVTTT